MQNAPSASTGTTDRLEIGVPRGWLPFDLVCGPAVSVEHLSAVMYPGASASAIARLTSTAAVPAGTPVSTRVIVPESTRIVDTERVSSSRRGAARSNPSPLAGDAVEAANEPCRSTTRLAATLL